MPSCNLIDDDAVRGSLGWPSRRKNHNGNIHRFCRGSSVGPASMVGKTATLPKACSPHSRSTKTPLGGASLHSGNGGRTRARTWDPLIKSQLLYQLSYAPDPTRRPGRPGAVSETPYIRRSLRLGKARARHSVPQPCQGGAAWVYPAQLHTQTRGVVKRRAPSGGGTARP